VSGGSILVFMAPEDGEVERLALGTCRRNDEVGEGVGAEHEAAPDRPAYWLIARITIPGGALREPKGRSAARALHQWFDGELPNCEVRSVDDDSPEGMRFDFHVIPTIHPYCHTPSEDHLLRWQGKPARASLIEGIGCDVLAAIAGRFEQSKYNRDHSSLMEKAGELRQKATRLRRRRARDAAETDEIPGPDDLKGESS